MTAEWGLSFCRVKGEVIPAEIADAVPEGVPVHVQRRFQKYVGSLRLSDYPSTVTVITTLTVV